MPNKYLIINIDAGYLTSAGTFSRDRSQAATWSESDKNALMQRYRATCFACPA